MPNAAAVLRLLPLLRHVVDWHTTFAALGGAAPNPAAFPLDGFDVFAAVQLNTTSPRQGFPINIDPLANCQGPDGGYGQPGCVPAMAYRHLNYKYLQDVANDTYYPLPTTRGSPYAPRSWFEIHTGGTRGGGGGDGGRNRRQPGPAGLLVTALFDLDKDPSESNNLLVSRPTDPAVLAAVGLIKQKLLDLALAAVPPGNATTDGRFQKVYTALGGVAPWCPYPTEAQCQSSATPAGPDGN